MTVQVQELLMCATVYGGIAIVGFFYVAKERRDARVKEPFYGYASQGGDRLVVKNVSLTPATEKGTAKRWILIEEPEPTERRT